MKIAYLGLPLGALLLHHDGHELVLVALSRTDAPGFYRAGVRFGDRLIVKPDARDPSLIERARQGGAELLVSWFWTTLIPAALVDACPRGGIGVHPSLLPRHRGADPYFWAIERGDRETGVSVHRIAPRYDTGAVIEQRRLAIDPAWNSWDLARALDRPSLAALRSVVTRMASGEALPEAMQDESLATEAPRPGDEASALHFSSSTDEVLRRVRALAPAPGGWFELGDRDVCLLKAARAESFPLALEPGEAAELEGRVIVRTADGAIEILEAELDGAPTNRADLACVVRALRGRSDPW